MVAAGSLATSRLALYTVVHPGSRRFLRAWYESVTRQSDAHFDLWASLDGLGTSEVAREVGSTPECRWLPVPPGTSKAALREQGIRQLTDQYPAIVFVDSDDLLAPERLASARAALLECDIAGCGLRIMDESARDLGVVFGPPPGVGLEQLLVRYNVLGLSNTAYRSDLLRRCLPIPHDTELMDWLLAVRSLALGARMRFDPVPGMWYRQYGANTAVVLPPISPEQLLRATELVRRHYEAVLGASWPLPALLEGQLNIAATRVKAFQGSVTRSKALLRAYLDAVNRLEVQYVWWWYVAHPKLEGLWNS
jgi:hypothetical protein